MSDKPSLSEVIKQLKVELIAAQKDGSETGLSIESVKVSIGFEAIKNETGDTILRSSSKDHASHINLKFARQKTDSIPSELVLLEDELEKQDGFDSFKKRFEASVKKKHGHAGSKKKSVFDGD